MKAITWIIIGIAIAGIGFYAYKKSKKSEKSIIDKITKIKREITTTETCEVVKQNDVVAYFKSLPLINGRHIPFVARANVFTQYLPNISVPNGEYNVVLGVYDEPSDELTSCKIVIAQNWDSDFASLIGKEELVVLN